MMRRSLYYFIKQSNLFFFVAMGISNSLVFAGTSSFSPTSSVWGCWLRPVIALGAGAAITTDLTDSQTFPIVNPTTDQFYRYQGNSSTQTQALIDVFLGAEWGFHPNWALQLGLAYNHPNDFNLKGTLTQGVDLISQDQFKYHYPISAEQFLVEGKLLYTFRCIFHPYILVGLGVSSNQGNNFSTNVPPFLTFTRLYASHTEIAFSYNIGVGIDFDVTNNIRLGIGYRFADFGEAKLGSARIDTTNVPGTLSQNNLSAHEILGQVTLML